jgi:hypothetical protein
MIHVDPAEWLNVKPREARSIGAVLATLPEIAALRALERRARGGHPAALRPFSG